MSKFWRWIYWLCFELHMSRVPTMEELIDERGRLYDERAILNGEIAANEAAILQCTLNTGRLTCR